MDGFERYAAGLPQRDNPFHDEASKLLNDYVVEVSFRYGEPPCENIPGIKKTETTIGSMRTWAALFNVIANDFSGQSLSATYFIKLPFHLKSIELDYNNTDGVETSCIYLAEYVNANLFSDIWIAEAERGRTPKGRYWKGDPPIRLRIVMDGHNIDKVLEGHF